MSHFRYPRTSGKTVAYPQAAMRHAVIPVSNPEHGMYFSSGVHSAYNQVQPGHPHASHPRIYQHSQHQPSRHHRRQPVCLPEELVEEIMSHADKATLAVCARASHRLYPAAQRKFFHDVSIHFEASLPPVGEERRPRATPRALYGLLRRSKHLAELIRELTVHVGAKKAEGEEREYLHSLFPLLKRLKKLSYPRLAPGFPRNHGTDRTNLSYLPPLTQEQGRHLTDLDVTALSSYQFPVPWYFHQLPGLRHLVLDFSFLDNQALDMIMNQPGRYDCTMVRPQKLSLTGSFRSLGAQCLLNSPKFPFDIALKLTRLDLTLPGTKYVEDYCERDLTAMAALFEICRNLEDFSFGKCPCNTYYLPTSELRSSYSILAAPPSLAACSALKTLSLRGELVTRPNDYAGGRIRRDDERWLPATPIAWISALLASVPLNSQSMIEEIDIYLTVPFFAKLLLEFMGDQWTEIYDVLGSHRFPRLKKIILTVRCDPYDNASVILGRSKALTKMRKRGILELKIKS